MTNRVPVQTRCVPASSPWLGAGGRLDPGHDVAELTWIQIQSQLRPVLSFTRQMILLLRGSRMERFQEKNLETVDVRQLPLPPSRDVNRSKLSSPATIQMLRLVICDERFL